MKVVAPAQQVMEAALELRSLRANLLAQNVANADTPGYLSRDIRFQDAIDRMVEQGKTETAAAQTTSTVALQNLRFDRNDVDLNQQLAKVYDNSLGYLATLKLYGDSMGRVREAMANG